MRKSTSGTVRIYAGNEEGRRTTVKVCSSTKPSLKQLSVCCLLPSWISWRGRKLIASHRSPLRVIPIGLNTIKASHLLLTARLPHTPCTWGALRPRDGHLLLWSSRARFCESRAYREPTSPLRRLRKGFVFPKSPTRLNPHTRKEDHKRRTPKPTVR